MEEPHVDLDVEEDEGEEGDDAQQDGAGDVHVVLDVDGVVPAKMGIIRDSSFFSWS